MKRKININELLWFLILTLFMIYFYKLLLTGDISNFIHPKMYKHVKFSIIALGILAIYQLGNLFNRERNTIRLGYLVFLFPVLLAVLLSPQGLNAETVKIRGISKTSNSIRSNLENLHRHQLEVTEKNFLDINEGLYLNLQDYIGKNIIIQGMVYKDDNLETTQFVVARMVISCCAADAEVVGFLCNYEQSKNLNLNQWVKVTGVVDSTTNANSKGKDRIPMIRVEKIENISAPVNKYIYP